ncbi:hypothetical protein XENOCAPTIV_029044, partial [Xenoophorus captivus]
LLYYLHHLHASFRSRLECCCTILTFLSTPLLQQVGHGAGHQGEDLLGVFSTRTGSTNNPLDSSALCVFPLDELDRHIDSTRDLCYTQDGWVEGRGEVAYIEYEVKSSCANLPLNTLNAYPCGSDHTPSPMASKIPLAAKAVWQTSMARLTAVAVSVREGHSIAFLGDARGNLHKVRIEVRSILYGFLLSECVWGKGRVSQS